MHGRFLLQIASPLWIRFRACLYNFMVTSCICQSFFSMGMEPLILRKQIRRDFLSKMCYTYEKSDCMEIIF